jgi:hypothetical protein
MTRERMAQFTLEDWRRNPPCFQEPLLSRHQKAFASSVLAMDARRVAIARVSNNPAVTGSLYTFAALWN